MPAHELDRLVFWQDIPSIHQAPLLRSLAIAWGGEVTVVTERDVPARRRSQGWERPVFDPARLVISPSEGDRKRFLEERPDTSIHIFSGFHADPGTYATFRAAIRRQLGAGVFAEPGQSDGVKGTLRRLRYAGHAIRWGRHLKFVLATGELGVEWYRRCGFPATILHRIGYFVEPVRDQDALRRDRATDFRWLFVGRLVERKGVDLLLRALGRLGSGGWSLDVVGHGRRSGELRALASRRGLESKVRWHGTVPNSTVRSLMGTVDCLVLPSRHDGWGAVVNEALLAGTPAVVSDATGSSDLIRGPLIGDVFESGSVEALTGTLGARMRGGSLGSSDRRAIRRWAEEFVSPEAGAAYLISVLRFALGEVALRPTAPWRYDKAAALARHVPK